MTEEQVESTKESPSTLKDLSIRESPSIRPPGKINLGPLFSIKLMTFIKPVMIVLVVLLIIASITGAVFWFKAKQEVKNGVPQERPQKQPVEERRLPLLSFEKLRSDLLSYKSDYPLIVNGEPVTWKELEEAIRYDLEVWQIRGEDSSEERELLVNRLVDRRLIEQLAQARGIAEPTPEEIEAVKLEMFGPSYDFTHLVSFPEFHAQIKTKTLRRKIKQSLVRTYTGALIYAKYKSVGADEMREKGIDPQVRARKKVEEYYSLSRDKSLEEVIELANADEEMMALNDGKKIRKFVEIEAEEVFNPDVKDELRKLLPNQTSEIFVISGVLRPETRREEDYGYGFIKLEGSRWGEIENFEQFLEKEREKANLEVYI